MLATLSILAVLLPLALCHCDMPNQMFGTAVYTPTSSEIDSHYMAVDFIAQKAIIWPFVDGFSGRYSPKAYKTKDFKYYDFKAKKVYTANKNGKCSISSIDSDIEFPVVNPSTDTEYNAYKGGWNTIYKKGDLKLMVTNSKCLPFTGSLLQVKTGEKITMSYSFYERPIRKYDVLYPDLRNCK